MKRVLMFILFLLLTMPNVMAQYRDEVNLVLHDFGESKEAAIHNTLMDAIEQVFVTFISKNKSLLENKQVQRDLTNSATGVVECYKELYGTDHFVTLKTTISISKLLAYAKAKGSSVELVGSLFDRNLKIAKLSTKNEKEAIEYMFGLLYTPEKMFDFKLNLGELRLPKYNEMNSYSKNAYYALDATVDVLSTTASSSFDYIALVTMWALSLSEEEELEYEKMELPVYHYCFPCSNESSSLSLLYYSLFDFRLRNMYSSYHFENAAPGGYDNNQLTEKLVKCMEKYATMWILKDNLSTPSKLSMSNFKIDLTPETARKVRKNPWRFSAYSEDNSSEEEKSSEEVISDEYKFSDDEENSDDAENSDDENCSDEEVWSNSKFVLQYHNDKPFVCRINDISNGTVIGKVTFTIFIPQADISKYTKFEIVPKTFTNK